MLTLVCLFVKKLCPSLNFLFRAHNPMDSHMLNWASIDIEKLPSLPLLTPLWRQHSLFKSLRLTAAGWGISLKNFVDFTWALLHFYKVVRLFWKKSRDALISWYIMRLHGLSLFRHFFRQVANNMNCEASSAVRTATASVALSGSCFSKSTALMFPNDSICSMSLIFRVASKSILMYSLEMLKVWLQEMPGSVCPVSWMHFTVTCWKHLNHPIRYPHRWHSKLSWPFAHNVVKRPPKKSIAKSPRLVAHIFHRFHQIVIRVSEYIRPLFFDASHA